MDFLIQAFFWLYIPIGIVYGVWKARRALVASPRMDSMSIGITFALNGVIWPMWVLIDVLGWLIGGGRRA